MNVREFKERYSKKLRKLGFYFYDFQKEGYYKMYCGKDITTYQKENVMGDISFTWSSIVCPIDFNVEFPTTNRFNVGNGGINVFKYSSSALEYIENIKPIIEEMQKDLELLKPILEELEKEGKGE